eukprot:154512_1
MSDSYPLTPSVFTSIYVVTLVISIPTIFLLIIRRNAHPLKGRNFLPLICSQVLLVILLIAQTSEKVFGDKIPCALDFLCVDSLYFAVFTLYGLRVYLLWNANKVAKEANACAAARISCPNPKLNYIEKRWLRSRWFQAILCLSAMAVQLVPSIIFAIRSKDLHYSECKELRQSFVPYFMGFTLLWAIFYCVASFTVVSINDVFFLRNELFVVGVLLTFEGIALPVAFSFLPLGDLHIILFMTTIHISLLYFSSILPALHTFRPPCHKIQEKLLPKSLNSLLATEKGANSFRKHLMKEFSVENIQFYEAVDEFRETSFSGNLLHMYTSANKINQKYIKPGSPMEVNISSKKRSLLCERINAKKISPTMFDDAYNEIYKLMSEDPFRRYLKEASKLLNESEKHYGFIQLFVRRVVYCFTWC